MFGVAWFEQFCKAVQRVVDLQGRGFEIELASTEWLYFVRVDFFLQVIVFAVGDPFGCLQVGDLDVLGFDNGFQFANFQNSFLMGVVVHVWVSKPGLHRPTVICS